MKRKKRGRRKNGGQVPLRGDLLREGSEEVTFKRGPEGWKGEEEPAHHLKSKGEEEQRVQAGIILKLLNYS